MFLIEFAFAMDVPVASYHVHIPEPEDPLTWETRLPTISQSIGQYQIIGLQGVNHTMLQDILRDAINMKEAGTTSEADRIAPILYQPRYLQLIHQEYQELQMEWTASSAPQAVLVNTALFVHRESKKTFRVCNVAFPEERAFDFEKAVRLIRGRMILSGSDYNFLLGDFGRELEEKESELLADMPLEDVWSNPRTRCRTSLHTKGSMEPGARGGITQDFIFTDHPDVFWSCVEEKFKDGYFVSDHFLVFVILRE